MVGCLLRGLTTGGVGEGELGDDNLVVLKWRRQHARTLRFEGKLTGKRLCAFVTCVLKPLKSLPYQCYSDVRAQSTHYNRVRLTRLI